MPDSMADKRAERRRQMEQIAPGSGVRAFFDRGAWNAAGQTEPGKWSWPRATLQMLAAFAVLFALSLVVEVGIPTFVGLGIAYVLLLARGYALHRRFVRGRAAD
jgi:hypothetical protein